MAEGMHWRTPQGHHGPWDSLSRVAPSGATSTERRRSMTWQTPQAADFRFGFEITMYVSAR